MLKELTYEVRRINFLADANRSFKLYRLPNFRIKSEELTSCIFDLVGKVEDVSKVQTLLFSATLPSWVKQVLPF